MEKKVTFTERRKLIERITKDLVVVATQLSHMAVVLTDEAEHMAAAEKRFASRPRTDRNQSAAKSSRASAAG